MRLAKLTLQGFKSFADRTEFRFDDQVTGVVGPNGCGKSNIVDAVKWVLGERSSKSLRGKEMLDVIFAGSAGRSPAGMALVMLTFDNPVIDPDAPLDELSVVGDEPDQTDDTDHETEVAERRRLGRKKRGLPIDTDTVEVERRLHRDGSSEYLINGRKARLRDIRDLFLDTGIGADAYSIIEQGKVDAMLLASPMERRTIFEEAAGIARYKARRIESQRKLDRAMNNLTLTREQLDSTERRLRLVKGQAVKAKRFQELDEELRALRAALVFDQYDELLERLDGLTSSMAKLETERSDAQQRLSDAEQAKQEAELERHERAGEHKRLEEERIGAVHTGEQAAQRIEMTERAMADALRQSESDSKRLGELDTKVQRLSAESTGQDERIADLTERLAEAERELAEAGTARAAIMEELATRQAALSQTRASVAEIDRERTGLLASIEADERRLETLREQLASREHKVEAIAEDQSQIDAERSVAVTSVDQKTSAAARLEETIKSLDASSESLGADRRVLADRVTDLDQRLVRAESRHATLREMVEARVGLGEAVKRVLDERDESAGAEGRFAGVVAPLADLIETDAEHAEAVEAALGAALRALVVDSLGAMPSETDLESLNGRVSFVPAQGLGPIEHAEVPGGLFDSMPAGRVVKLRGVVRSVAAGSSLDLSGLLDRLLGSTYLVDSLDAAMMLRSGPLSSAASARFVTRKGEVLERDGRVTAGPLSSDEDGVGGVLSRRAELSDLAAELSTLNAVLDRERRKLESADAETARLNAELSSAQHTLAGEQRELVAAQNRLDRLDADLARLARERESAMEEAGQVRERIERIDTDRGELRERAEKLGRLGDERRDLVSQTEADVEKLKQRQEAASDQLTATKVGVGTLGEQLASSKRERAQARMALDDAERQRRELRQQMDRAAEREKHHTETIETARQQIAESDALAAQLAEQASAEAEALETAAAESERLGTIVKTAREHATRIERDWQSLEVSRREVEVRRENLEERAIEDDAIDLARDHFEYRALVKSGVTRVDHADAQARINVLRDEIGKLGNVNIDAIEEEKHLADRNEDLIRQVADLDEARKTLTELIERLNIASKERFGEVFETIREEFGGPNGMFRRLFGGGRAEVRLMPLIKEVDGEKVVTDETDLLESGIEVIAKPPGKEPRSISQLSGGEKSLTAVALLMAIFKSKPSCFCVLDEVDAALDEANVDRFSRVVQAFTDFSHFIVITHHKRTMQACDRLYGVTMQERGVSKRVSVKFEHVEHGGELKKEALESPAEDVPRIEKPKPSGKLRAALAGMRSEEAVEVGAAQAETAAAVESSS